MAPAPTQITIPTLVTDRLVFRAWQPSDVEPYSAMNADEETMRYLDGTIAPAATWWLLTHVIEHWHLRGCGMWALEPRETGEFVGRAGLYEGWDWPGAEASWTVRRDLWGRGLATEAGAAAVARGWEHLAVENLVSVIEPGNIGSCKVAEKLDFHLERHADVGQWKDQLYRLRRPTFSSPCPEDPGFTLEGNGGISRP